LLSGLFQEAEEEIEEQEKLKAGRGNFAPPMNLDVPIELDKDGKPLYWTKEDFEMAERAK
jgi:hypothetical protein